MARSRRLRIAGLSHHVIQRGNNRAEMFRDDADYENFLALLREHATRSETHIHAYALMRNHVHILATPNVPAGISSLMHGVGSRYAQLFNRRHARTGALFEGRYRSFVIDTDRYWLACMRYVELNPVRAGLVSRPDAYYWTSYAFSAFGAPDPVITPHRIYECLGASDSERQEFWRRVCGDTPAAEELQDLRRAAHRGGALGTVPLPAGLDVEQT